MLSPVDRIRGSRKDQSSGFSLLELLLVCLLLSLLLGLVIPSLQWSWHNAPLKKGVRQLSNMLREARAVARREGQAGWLWFSQAESKAGYQLVAPIGEDAGQTADRQVVLPAGVGINKVLVAGEQEVAEPAEVWISPRGFLQETWVELRYEESVQWLRLHPLIDRPELAEKAPGRAE